MTGSSVSMRVWYLPVLIAMGLVSASIIVLPAALATDRDGSEHDYHNNPLVVVLFTFLMSYATMAILVSLFTFKFAAKRSRFLAVPLIVSGILPWGMWVVFKLVLRSEYPDDTLLGIVHWVAAPLLLPIMALIGFTFGVGVALFIFLTIIVRS